MITSHSLHTFMLNEIAYLQLSNLVVTKRQAGSGVAHDEEIRNQFAGLALNFIEVNSNSQVSHHLLQILFIVTK